MRLTLLLVQQVAGHGDGDGMDTSVAPADDILAFTNGVCSLIHAAGGFARRGEGAWGAVLEVGIGLGIGIGLDIGIGIGVGVGIGLGSGIELRPRRWRTGYWP